MIVLRTMRLICRLQIEYRPRSNQHSASKSSCMSDIEFPVPHNLNAI